MRPPPVAPTHPYRSPYSFFFGVPLREAHTGKKRAKPFAHFAEIQIMTSTTKNAKAALNVIGCLALLHAIRSNKSPKCARLRTGKMASV
jgi:hypothetical protein